VDWVARIDRKTARPSRRDATNANEYGTPMCARKGREQFPSEHYRGPWCTLYTVQSTCSGHEAEEARKFRVGRRPANPASVMLFPCHLIRD
jgi:hypothetical protein